MIVRYKDLELAIDYLKKVKPEVVEFDLNEAGGSAMSIAFTELNKPTKIFIFEAGRNVTPEIRATQKLYRKD